MFQSFKRRLYYLYFITLLLPELRLQTKRTTAPIYKEMNCPNSTNHILPADRGLARLGLARLGCIQPIALEEFGHAFPAVDPVFPAKLQLLRL